MKLRRLCLSISIALALGGCAGAMKQNRIGNNDGSDPCYLSLDRLDNIAIYYKDQRMNEIAAGVILGAATGAGAAALAGGNSTAVLISSFVGGISGGFVADAYWKNKMQTLYNQLDSAQASIERDIQSDIQNISQIDQEISTLVRCRTETRDQIKHQFASGAINEAEAQKRWKAWGDQLQKDRQEMQYLSDALNNIKKIEQSYSFAANAIENTSYITEEMQNRWKAELEAKKAAELAAAEAELNNKLLEKKLTKKAKTALHDNHKQKVTEISESYKAKENNVKNKINPNGNPLKPLVSTMQEKQESVQKNTAKFANLEQESKNNRGFEQINSLLPHNMDWLANGMDKSLIRERQYMCQTRFANMY
ncbi:hypothetical protein KEF85_07955 [Methylomonas paludis]|uniref:Glycine zipper domain-containing protein n=1 Tax=Methylomonas paludis TaxID=1173101 RepID=A0A975RBJ9_9GAMM|nr:hypothetical protein [Methylomonas paludis]QWF72366.1 hypothetical protein KEF85_07955 [Methylomonas paludis]